MSAYTPAYPFLSGSKARCGKSYIVTGGSSSGVLTMLYVASKRGNKLIVPRNSHQSVWNACKLFGVEPVIVQGEEKDGIILPPSPWAKQIIGIRKFGHVNSGNGKLQFKIPPRLMPVRRRAGDCARRRKRRDNTSAVARAY